MPLFFFKFIYFSTIFKNMSNFVNNIGNINSASSSGGEDLDGVKINMNHQDTQDPEQNRP